MIYADKNLVWGGLALAVWVLYQCVSGRFAYKGRDFRRKDSPGFFWALIMFEALLSFVWISSGLGDEAPAEAVYVLLVLSAIAGASWSIQKSLRERRRYPRLFQLLKAGRLWEAAREMEAHLVSHPDDRGAMWMLACTYEKAGDRGAATETCALLAQIDDQYGYLAKKFLRQHTSAAGSVLDMSLGDVIRWSVRGKGFRRRL